MRARTVAVLAMLLLVAGAAPGRAWVPEQTPRRAAEEAGRRMLARPSARGPVAGIVVMRGPRVLWSLGGDRAMTPASLVKLATTYAAMRRFGPEHRFVTRVLADRKGPTPETLYLVGGGDPSFATQRYRRRRFLPQPDDAVQRPAFASGSPTVEDLARAVADGGVRRVSGDLVADDSLFDDVRTQRGWLRRYLRDEPDTGLLSALTVNAGYADLEQERILSSPARGTAEAVRRALARRGVTVGGTIRLARTPRTAVEIARVSSPPLAELIDYINRYSINYPSELLLKSLGAAFGKAGTTAAGVRVVRETLDDAGIGLDGFEMHDGSGLSVLNRMTPRMIAAILAAILRAGEPGMDTLRASIPVAGQPGTLLRRMTGPPTGQNLRGKTGQIRRVRAMAGWVTAIDGVPLVYVALFNDAPRPFALTPPLDLFGLLLARFPRP